MRKGSLVTACAGPKWVRATRPDRHHASRRSSSVPGDGVHDGDEQAHHAEAGPGLEGVGGVVDASELAPGLVGQNSVTGFRHESGSAWTIPGGRTGRPYRRLAMAAAGCRSKAPRRR